MNWTLLCCLCVYMIDTCRFGRKLVPAHLQQLKTLCSPMYQLTHPPHTRECTCVCTSRVRQVLLAVCGVTYNRSARQILRIRCRSRAFLPPRLARSRPMGPMSRHFRLQFESNCPIRRTMLRAIFGATAFAFQHGVSHPHVIC